MLHALVNLLRVEWRRRAIFGAVVCFVALVIAPLWKVELPDVMRSPDVGLSLQPGVEQLSFDATLHQRLDAIQPKPGWRETSSAASYFLDLIAEPAVP